MRDVEKIVELIQETKRIEDGAWGLHHDGLEKLMKRLGRLMVRWLERPSEQEPDEKEIKEIMRGIRRETYGRRGAKKTFRLALSGELKAVAARMQRSMDLRELGRRGVDACKALKELLSSEK